ncbi:MAG: ATP phosphoribosyltransferase regulatory subunit [Candidatus Taylorbacteria bacterium]
MKNKPRKKSKSSSKSKFIFHDHLDKIGEIALYYGFMPMKSPTVNDADIKAAKDILDGDFVDDETENHARFPLHAEEKIAFIRTYHEQNMHNHAQPVMLYFKDTCRSPLKKSGQRYADLEILGASGSIAEATLIQTARAMLSEEKYTDTVVEINSIGDRDSITRFSRELTAYYRKNINEMTPECRQVLKRDPFELLSSHRADCKALNAAAPKSIDFLSEQSRRHLEEVLEYLEALNIPYTINNGLIGNRKYCTETIFTIVNAEQKILAIGVRYNSLAKRAGMKRDIQGVGISLLIKNNVAALRKPLAKSKKPLSSFMQLSPESKLMSLAIIEILRLAKIPLFLSLAKDRLGAQVSSVERHHTPYVIVMGKKEAVEKTIIIRRTETHAQEIIPLDQLTKHMKKIEAQYWK